MSERVAMICACVISARISCACRRRRGGMALWFAKCPMPHCQSLSLNRSDRELGPFPGLPRSHSTLGKTSKDATGDEAGLLMLRDCGDVPMGTKGSLQKNAAQSIMSPHVGFGACCQTSYVALKSEQDSSGFWARWSVCVFSPMLGLLREFGLGLRLPLLDR